MNVNTSVIVTNDAHPRIGQAGTVQSSPQEIKKTVEIKFDVDGVTEDVKVADLRVI